jgi:hypothetical protein
MESPQEFIPWEKYPDLKSERLSVLEGIIRRVREGVASSHEPKDGDGAWGFGCRAYERTCFAITNAIPANSWLTILPDKSKPLRFTFAVGNVPFRFYRGDPNDPPSRHLSCTFEEFRQQRLAIELGVPIDSMLRLAVETDAEGKVSQVSVVELDASGNVMGTYAIPSGVQPNVVPFRAKPIDTAPPTVEPIQTEPEQREERNASGE